jgi:hypothetical protein
LIYEAVDLGAGIRQGDIFTSLPRAELSLVDVTVFDPETATTFGRADWRELAPLQAPSLIVVPIRAVPAIVVTQDCDCVRATDITLCEIRPFRDVEKKAADTKSPKSWKGILTQQARLNLKWFYLPPHEVVNFDEKMAVDFQATIRLPREELEGLRDMRKARLNALAEDHFRQRLSEFFRRYAYDEWYALDAAELTAYQQEYPGTPPYEWQKPPTPPTGT